MLPNAPQSRCWLLGLLAAALVLGGCAGRTMMESPGRPERMAMKSAPAPASGFAAAADMAAPEARGGQPAAEAETTPARMIHHDGFIHLRTPRPSELVEAATGLVEASGGHVERLEGDSAVFRVPVAEFQAVFTQLLALGDVLDQSVTTEDITDAFMDVDLRLNIARATHERLVELLAKAPGEKEKIRILREIQRIRIEMETLSAQRERLLSLAAFSRITLRIEARRLDTDTGRQESISAFEWIHQLSPFNDQVARSGTPFKFHVPEGMVALERQGLWVAESANGAVMRASRHVRQPAGDTAFWLEAVHLRLGPDYAEARVMDVGAFKVLRLEDRSETPYIYLVGFHVTPARTLEMVEVYFPTSDLEKRYLATVLASIDGGAR
jgi:hypothetical protein